MKYAFAAAFALICSTAPSLADSPWTSGLADETLVAVDDSTVTLSPMEGRLVLEYTSHGGLAQKTVFAFVSDKMGTVSDDDGGGKPDGFFRQTDVGVDIQYDDGRTASLFANVADGLTMMRHGMGGETVCVSWYPKDHVFSAAEKHAAVAAFAQSLGVSERQQATPAPKRKHAHLAPQVQPVANICSPAIKAPRSVTVSNAGVHPIDAPVMATPAPAPVAAAPAPVPVKVTAGPEMVPVGTGASQCLSVEVLGGYVGFRNRCGNDVQVTYCIQKGSDPAVTCGTGAKLGSVAGSAFTGVFADNAAAERDIRWVGCSGGVGEVTPELDRADPPSGRCLKKTQ